MKTRTLIAAYGLLFVMLLGIAGLIVQTQATIPATVKINPPMYSLEDPAASYINVFVGLPKPYKVAEIDPTTVYVEGVLQNANPNSSKVTGKWFKFMIDGPSFINLLKTMIGHMEPGYQETVSISVTGELNDGTLFQGSDEVTIKNPYNDPDPLP